MGNIMRIPIQPAPTSFLHWSLYNPAGEPMKAEEWQYAPGQELLNTDALFNVSNVFCQPLINERLQKIRIKNKFLDANIDMLTIKFSLTSNQIRDLKAEFQLFDTKKVGVISYEDLCKILNDLGDTNSVMRREKLFMECDQEDKGTLDFEQYLQYMDTISEKGQKKALGKDKRFSLIRSTYGSGAVRRLSILNQISTGIF